MFKFRFSLFSLSLFSLFGQCVQSQPKQAGLPQNLPANLQIEYRYSAGMLPQSEGIFISRDSCYVEYYYNQAHNKIAFKMSEKELKKLYEVFVKHRYERIKTKSEQVYDRGGDGIRLSFDKRYIDVSNSGMSFVLEDGQRDYKACVEAIQRVAYTKIEAQKQDFQIVFDESITKTGAIINLQIADAKVNYYSEEQGAKKNLPTRLFKGTHHFYMHLTAKTEPAHERKNIASKHFNFEVTAETKGITLSLKDNELTYKIW